MASKIIRPGAIGFYNGWSSSAGGTNRVPEIDPLDPLTHDDDALYLFSTASSTEASFTTLASSLPPSVLRVNSLTAWVRGRHTAPPSQVQLSWRLNAVDNYLVPGVDFTSAYTDQFRLLTAPAAGWSVADLSAIQFGVFQSTLGVGARVTSLWLVVDYLDSAQIESAREIGSRRLRARRLPTGLLEVLVPSLEYIDHELVDLIGISNPELPSLDGQGAGVQPWQRWPCVKVRSEIRWDSGSELMQLRDLRDYLCTFWDMGKSLTASALWLDGVARLTSATRSWTRSTPAYPVTPSGDRVVKIGVNSEKLDKDGLTIEGASTNEVIQSAFKNGAFTGWTVSGSGTIAPDTADLLFESSVSAQSAKITAAATIGTDLQAQGTATRSFSSNAVVRASLWHKDDSGFAMSYALQRAFDSNWWRDSDQTWQASKTWNALPSTAARARHKSKQISVGANATTLTVFFGVPTTGQGGQVNHCYHVQVEEKKFMTSTIPTETIAVARAADLLTMSNYSQAPTWPPDRGLFRCYVVTGWDAVDVAGTNKTLMYIPHDASNYDWLYYDGANTRLVFERVAAGVPYRATATHSPVAGATYKIVARWTSDLQELGLPARTLSLFVDGLKGQDTTAAALAIQTASTIEQGSKASTEHADCAMWGIEIIQQAFDDESAVRF